MSDYEVTPINEIATALAKAQGQIEGARRSKENPHLHSRYADLASVLDALREPFSQNGISYVQTFEPGTDYAHLTVRTTLYHTSGQYLTSLLTVPMPPAQGNYFHALGSAITYLRRYSIMAIAGIAPDDDDDATEANKAQAQAQAQAAKPAANGNGIRAQAQGQDAQAIEKAKVTEEARKLRAAAAAAGYDYSKGAVLEKAVRELIGKPEGKINSVDMALANERFAARLAAQTADEDEEPEQEQAEEAPLPPAPPANSADKAAGVLIGKIDAYLTNSSVPKIHALRVWMTGRMVRRQITSRKQLTIDELTEALRLLNETTMEGLQSLVDQWTAQNNPIDEPGAPAGA